MEGLVTVLKGTILSIILTLILLFIFATVLTYTNVAEGTIPAVIIIITAMALGDRGGAQILLLQPPQSTPHIMAGGPGRALPPTFL